MKTFSTIFTVLLLTLSSFIFIAPVSAQGVSDETWTMAGVQLSKSQNSSVVTATSLSVAGFETEALCDAGIVKQGSMLSASLTVSGISIPANLSTFTGKCHKVRHAFAVTLNP